MEKYECVGCGDTFFNEDYAEHLSKLIYFSTYHAKIIVNCFSDTVHNYTINKIIEMFRAMDRDANLGEILHKYWRTNV